MKIFLHNPRTLRPLSAVTCFSLLTLSLSSGLGTQARADDYSAPTAGTMTQPLTDVPAGKILLTERTPVKIILDQDLKSGADKVGEEIDYETANDLYSPDRQLIAPAGTKVYGHVLKSSGHGMFGKGGKLEISADYILMPDRTKVPLRGDQIGGGGKSETTGMIAMTALVSVLGVFINGRDVQLHKGTEIQMYVNEDTIVTPYMAMVQPGGIAPPMPGIPYSTASTPQTQAQSGPKMIYTLKTGQQVVGEQQAFDGVTYAVNTDTGLQLVKASQLKTAPVPASKMMYILRDGTQVMGIQTAFDGSTYAVMTDSGVKLLKAADIKTMYQLVAPGAPAAPAPAGSPQVVQTTNHS